MLRVFSWVFMTFLQRDDLSFYEDLMRILHDFIEALWVFIRVSSFKGLG